MDSIDIFVDLVIKVYIIVVDYSTYTQHVTFNIVIFVSS